MHMLNISTIIFLVKVYNFTVVGFSELRLTLR